MTYSPVTGNDTSLAGLAHLGAALGPVVPLAVWLARRADDPWVTREAAKAANAGMAFLAAFVAATLVEVFVPLVGFVGRLAQLATVIVAVAMCVHAFRRVRRGLPTSYPLQIRVLPFEA